jgi:hypothetical protein
MVPLGIVFIKNEKNKITIESHLGMSDLNRTKIIDKKDKLYNLTRSYLILINVRKTNKIKTLQIQNLKFTTPDIYGDNDIPKADLLNNITYLQNNKLKDNLKILLESDGFTEDDSFIDLSKARNSLGDIETQLDKLLNS